MNFAKPFQRGDRIKVSDHWRGSPGAPRSDGVLYVIDCWPIDPDKQRGPAHFFVSLVGMPGFKPRGGKPSGHYNAGFFKLVCRDPARSVKR